LSVTEFLERIRRYSIDDIASADAGDNPSRRSLEIGRIKIGQLLPACPRETAEEQD
jgi:hypothetical protein